MSKKLILLIPLLLSLILTAKSFERNSKSTDRNIQDNKSAPEKIELSRNVEEQATINYEENVFKEIQFAKKLYHSGDHIKAKNVLKILKKDNNRSLSEQAHYLCLKWYNNLFIPIEATKDTKYAIDTKELDHFKNTFPRSKYISELEYLFKKDLEIFNSIVRKSRNSEKVDLRSSCPIRYRNDSTYVCTFHSKYRSKDNEEHDLVVKVSGKIKKYDTWNDDGLQIDDDSRISIKIDNEERIIVKDYVEHKQAPEYELMKVNEWGIESEKRVITKANAENTTQLATYLTNELIMPNFKVQFVYGKMNELLTEESDQSFDILNDRFNSECFVELRLNEFDQ